MIIRWVIIGILATTSMTIPQLVLIWRYDKRIVPEFYENAHLLTKIFPSYSWEELYWKATPLHYLHGVLGATALGIVLCLFEITMAPLIAFVYALILWIGLLLIHKPITGENILQQRGSLLTSFFSHLFYSGILLWLF
ncbi:MAG: hypothetical protein ACFFE8_05140 [Candidatus Heimdallarchaeota archaeon]